MKHSTILLILICFISCNKTRFDNSESVMFFYHSRECNYAWIDNAQKTILADAPIKDSYTIEPMINRSEVLSKNYLLLINTSNVDKKDVPIDNYLNYANSVAYDPLNRCPYLELGRMNNPQTNVPDLDIERIIKQVNKTHTKKGSSSSHYTNLQYIDYRISKLSGLKITCNKTLFGLTSGASLNDYIELSDFPVNHYFIISSNKQLVTSSYHDINGMSVDQYISYQPYLPAMIFLKLKSVPVEAPIEVTFSIQLEVDGVKTINSTSRVVKLLP